MKRYLSLLLVSSLIFISCNQSSSSADADSYENSKETLEEKERKNPSQFLIITGKDKRNIVGQTVIKGSIANTAKVCTYKDVNIELAFYSKTGTLLEKGTETIFEIIPPGDKASFKIKYFAPKGADDVRMKVLSAKAE